MILKKKVTIIVLISLLTSIFVICPNIGNKTVSAYFQLNPPNLQFKWIDDDGNISNDNNDGEIPNIPDDSDTECPVNIKFQIISKDHTYFGNTNQQEAMENISIKGNALFTGSLDNIPGVTFSSGTWNVPIIPTMGLCGGSINISATWKDYGSVYEILSIGGTDYLKNGTIVKVSPNDFNIDTDQTFTVEVQYADGCTNVHASVYLYYIGDGDGITNISDPLQGHILSQDTYGFDGYSLGFNKTQQRDNQTEAGFETIKAPRNLTVYSEAYVGGKQIYGWAIIRMDKNYGPNPYAIIETNMGTIKIKLYKSLVPNTVDNFIKLTKNNFYNGLVFHRVIDDFVIQGGGHYPNGTIKESPFGPIDLEIHPLARHVDGAIGMARTSDPNSATSQFYICDGSQHFLDDEYAVFGKVTSETMSVVRKIASVGTTTKYGMKDWPVDDVIINSLIIKVKSYNEEQISNPISDISSHRFIYHDSKFCNINKYLFSIL